MRWWCSRPCKRTVRFPDTQAYGPIVDDLVERFIGLGIAPEADTYRVLMLAYSKGGDADKVCCGYVVCCGNTKIQDASQTLSSYVGTEVLYPRTPRSKERNAFRSSLKILKRRKRRTSTNRCHTAVYCASNRHPSLPSVPFRPFY